MWNRSDEDEMKEIYIKNSTKCLTLDYMSLYIQ